jgi:hypothetical protein
VSDQGFDFGPTPPRREARPFEPPPWERDQFERHKREQAEREAAAEAARAAVLVEQEAARSAEQAAGPAAGAKPSSIPDQGEAKAASGGQEARPATPAPKAEVDEKQVAAMLVGLRAEEPVELEGAWVVNLAAGGVVALIGFASAIWGVTALTKKGLPAAGTLGGLVLLGFGLGFLGIGGWLVFKVLRQRGVL